MKSLITKEFGVPFNNLLTCLRNKWKILSRLVAFGEKGAEKRAREPENLVVKECVLKRFEVSCNNEIPLIWLLIAEQKRKNLHCDLKKYNFKEHTMKSLMDLYKKFVCIAIR